MYPGLFEIGPLTIYNLGVFWVLGGLAAVWILQPDAAPNSPDIFILTINFLQCYVSVLAN
jgi:hypothetical protein